MILIKYATRSRPALFTRRMENIRSTLIHTPYKVLVSMDNDDHTMSKSYAISVEKEFNCKVIVGTSKSKIDAINRDMDVSGEWDILVNMSDDMEFKVIGWDAILLKDIKDTWGDSTDFFAHYNDGYVKHKLPTMTIMGREYYNRFAYIYHPDYKSFSCDAEQMYVAMMLGRYKYFNKILFMHEHPTNNRTVKNDHLYARNAIYGDEDAATYFKRMKNNFDLPLEYKLPNELLQYV